MAIGTFNKKFFIELLSKLFSYKALSPCEFADGCSETNPDSERIEHTATKLQMRNSSSVEQIQDNSLIVLLLLTIISLCFFLGHYSGILIDFGREVYYPEQMLEGKVLYKDLFNIYGPLSYQINAVLYKIFGIKLSTLYFAGSICSVGIVLGIYTIARKFLSEFLSFAIGILTITVGVATTSIFNFHFPYSWAMVYGLLAFLISLYFLIKFTSPQSYTAKEYCRRGETFLCISGFFAGMSIACKYDFLLYALFVLFFIIKNKNWKAFLCFISVPLISYGILFLQGMRFSDLINILNITKSMANTDTLTYFYQNSGIYFSLPVIPYNIFSFLLFVIPFGGILAGYKFFQKKNIFIKIISSGLIVASFLFLYVLLNIKANRIFDFSLIFVFIFSVCFWKKLNPAFKILAVSTLFACAKVFWTVFLGSYGNYYISIILITAFALLFNVLHKKYEKITAIFILFISLYIYCMHFNGLYGQDILTNRGNIYTEFNQSINTNSLIKYINKNTNPSDKIVIFPEGMMINFLTNRKSDNFYNSLLPLYTETFGEEKIIEYFSNNKPDYIILNNLNMKDYYFKYICQDYAHEFCQFILDNYNQVGLIDENPDKYDFIKYTIFKLKP